jgi:hypothetical protein
LPTPAVAGAGRAGGHARFRCQARSRDLPTLVVELLVLAQLRGVGDAFKRGVVGGHVEHLVVAQLGRDRAHDLAGPETAREIAQRAVEIPGALIGEAREGPARVALPVEPVAADAGEAQLPELAADRHEPASIHVGPGGRALRPGSRRPLPGSIPVLRQGGGRPRPRAGGKQDERCRPALHVCTSGPGFGR